ncbi:MAG: beta-galactosidase [Clostridiales bacterium]|nr:beta-galactosidase [Clostridiales bacterium]
MLEIKGDSFYLNGEKFNIYAGAIHYFRVHPDYWRDRLEKLKAAGFNTVETYMAWNLHEKRQGAFDFTGILDIRRFLDTAQELGLYAIVRPGPYICAEWDFGGLPGWLLRDRNMRLRCMYEPYLDCVKRYYEAVYREIADKQITRGGNIIAMQVENEYGSYGNDKQYLRYIEKLMKDCGTEVLMFTSDGPNNTMLSGGSLPDVYKVGNFGSRVKASFDKLDEFQPGKPPMCGEFWNGWFDHWGGMHHKRPYQTLIPELKAMLERNGNFSFYMFHGGTNFGFTAGANYGKAYSPTVTSYDYDTLLGEWGNYTPKYHAVRKVLLEHQGKQPGQLPPEPQRQTIGRVALTEFASLRAQLGNLGTAHESVAAEPMEYFGQSNGLIHYHHDLKGNYDASTLSLDGLHDRAHVFLDGKRMGILYRNDKSHNVSLPAIRGGASIDVLVEGMGHVNYGPKMGDRKGVEQIRIDNQILFHWTITTLPMDNLMALEFGNAACEAPLFLRGTFDTSSRADCFVHLDGFNKGYVYVNGFNLGRYWNIGPQMSLYLPGPVLKDHNEIIVCELDGYKDAAVTLKDTHRLSKKRFLFF